MNKSYKILKMQNESLGIYTNDEKMDYIADLPKKATWFKNGNIITDKEISITPMYDKYEPYTFKYNAVWFKCPLCDQLHISNS